MHSYARLASSSRTLKRVVRKASLSDNVVTGCEAQPTNLHVSHAHNTLVSAPKSNTRGRLNFFIVRICHVHHLAT